MIIQKTFSYRGQEHTVSFEKKFAGNQLLLDGTLCKDVMDNSFSGVPDLKADITLNEENLSIRIYGKQIYILRDDLDIETSLPFAHPTARKKLWVRLSFLLLNSFHLFYLVIFYKRFIDFEQMGEDFLEPMSIILLACVILAVSIIGLRQCFYFADHPSLDKHEKTPRIVVTVIIVNIANTGLLALLNTLF